MLHYIRFSVLTKLGEEHVLIDANRRFIQIHHLVGRRYDLQKISTAAACPLRTYCDDLGQTMRNIL